MQNKNQIEYVRWVNDTIDYISKNLKEKITIDDLADVSCFSKFHFHRVFKSIIGENIYSFIKRVRLKKATIRKIILIKICILQIFQLWIEEK